MSGRRQPLPQLGLAGIHRGSHNRGRRTQELFIFERKSCLIFENACGDTSSAEFEPQLVKVTSFFLKNNFSERFRLYTQLHARRHH